jgi:hypothetical protein
LTDCCRIPSEADPYSPEIAEFAPLLTCGSVSVPAVLAVVPPVPSWNCCSTIGDAVSSPPLVDEHAVVPTLQETSLITRSPGAK